MSKDFELVQLLRLAVSMGIEKKEIARRCGYSEGYVQQWTKNCRPTDLERVKAVIVDMMRFRLHELNERVMRFVKE